MKVEIKDKYGVEGEYEVVFSREVEGHKGLSVVAFTNSKDDLEKVLVDTIQLKE